MFDPGPRLPAHLLVHEAVGHGAAAQETGVGEARAAAWPLGAAQKLARERGAALWPAAEESPSQCSNNKR